MNTAVLTLQLTQVEHWTCSAEVWIPCWEELELMWVLPQPRVWPLQQLEQLHPQVCIAVEYFHFSQYLPFIYLLQALSFYLLFSSLQEVILSLSSYVLASLSMPCFKPQSFILPFISFTLIHHYFSIFTPFLLLYSF